MIVLSKIFTCLKYQTKVVKTFPLKEKGITDDD